MTPQSAKAKGRRLQQWTANEILKNHKTLKPDDVRSTSMGAPGEDIQLSPAARRKVPLSIECKSKKSYAFYKDYDQAKANCPKGAEPIVVAKANNRNPVVIVDAAWFFENFKR